MDRDRRTVANPCSGPIGTTLLSSRQASAGWIRTALQNQVRLILLTGEAGSGKTWLWKTLARARGGDADWIGIDLFPTTRPEDVLGEIAEALGLPDAATPTRTRSAIENALWESSQDGRHHILVLDEAQNACDALLEEIRVLSNSLGRARGFAHMILCGQNSLSRRLRSRSLGALNSRIGARVHLGPIDIEEGRALLRQARPDRSWDEAEVEELHRWAYGNPRHLLTMAGVSLEPRSCRLAVELQPETASAHQRPIADLEREGSLVPRRPLAPTRPPLEVEDGMIEVGWEPDEEPSAVQGDPVCSEETTMAERVVAEPTATANVVQEEAIHDRYAALQAWQEWTANHPASGTSHGDSVVMSQLERTAVGVVRPQVRAETQQSFAPYSDLFTRAQSSQDPE
jgi:type II secretory pathway predicted ATPase ExeA